MQKLNLLCYSDNLYASQQMMLVEHANSIGVFDNIYIRHREELVTTDFYKTHKYILDKPKGGGMCLWKIFYMLKTLARMDEGDVLLYMDSADMITNSENIREEALKYMADKDMCLTDGAFRNGDWTRRDTFFYMECDEPKYWDSIQLEAGIMLLKNTDATQKVLIEWLYFAKDSRIITEDENVCGLPNLDGYKEHRYDQSILTNLKVKHNLFSSDFLRKFITCNYNMPCTAKTN